MLELPLDPVIMVQRSESELLAYNIDLDSIVQFKLPLNYETYILYQQMVINYYKKKHQHTETELSSLKIMYKTVYDNFVKMENQVKAYSSHNQYLLKKNQDVRRKLDEVLFEKRSHEEKMETLQVKEEEVKEVKEEEMIRLPEDLVFELKYDKLSSDEDNMLLSESSNELSKKAENFLNQIYKRIRSTSSYLNEPSKIVTFDRVLQKLSNFVNQYHFEEYKIQLNTGFFFRIFFKKENTYIDSIYYTQSYDWKIDSYFHQLEHFVKDDSQRIYYLNHVMTERIKKKSENQVFTKFFYRIVHLNFHEIHQLWTRVFDYFKLQSTYEVMMDNNEKYNHLIVFYPGQKIPLFIMNYDKERNKDPKKHHDFFMIWF